MTRIRGLAVRISERVARWAAPGSKEWAEGLAREVEFIDSDWRALAWAIGSTRVLLEPRDLSIDSLNKAVSEAESYFESTKARAQTFCVVGAAALVFAALLLLQVFTGLERVVEGFGLAASLYGIYALHRRMMRRAADALGPYELIAKYRLELARQYKYRNGWMDQLSTVAIFSMPVIPGVYDAVREHDRGMLTFCLALIAILWVPFMFFSTVRNYRANRKTRQRIAALDLLLATEQGGNG